jgi:hypothetical protein
MDAVAISECRSRCFRPIPSGHAIQRNRSAVRFDHQLGEIRSVPAQRSTASQTALVVESSMRQNKHTVSRIPRFPDGPCKPHPIRGDEEGAIRPYSLRLVWQFLALEAAWECARRAVLCSHVASRGPEARD